MRRIDFLGAAGVPALAVILFPLWMNQAGGDAPPAPAPTTQPADAALTESSAVGSLAQRGESLLRSLPKIEFGYSYEACHEAKRPDGKPLATTRTTVIARGIGDAMQYRYSNTSFVRDAKRNVIEINTQGYFDRAFRPISIEWEIIHQDSNGPYTTEKEKLVVGDTHTTFTRTSHDGSVEEKVYPTPQKPFVYLIDDLIRRLPAEPGDRFILRDLDPATGKLNRRTYHVLARPDGKVMVSLRKHPSKVETEYYLLSESGWLEKHTLHDLPLTFEVANESRVAALENMFRRFRTVPKPAP